MTWRYTTQRRRKGRVREAETKSQALAYLMKGCVICLRLWTRNIADDIRGDWTASLRDQYQFPAALRKVNPPEIPQQSHN